MSRDKYEMLMERWNFWSRIPDTAMGALLTPVEEAAKHPMNAAKEVPSYVDESGQEWNYAYYLSGREFKQAEAE